MKNSRAQRCQPGDELGVARYLGASVTQGLLLDTPETGAMPLCARGRRGELACERRSAKLTPLMARRQTGFIKSIRIDTGAGPDVRLAPALAGVDELRLDPSVTFFVGANGSGKSTLIEAIAIKAGLNAEGGSRNFRFATRDSHSNLYRHLTLSKFGTPSNDYFLRAESFYNVASAVEMMAGDDCQAYSPYGGRSLHSQSHGESFLALFIERFGPNGLFLLDEPEAALSAQGQLTLLRRMYELADLGCQLLVATHSPILLALPGAKIISFSEDGLEEVAYDDVIHVQLYRSFLAGPDQFLSHLLADGDFTDDNRG